MEPSFFCDGELSLLNTFDLSFLPPLLSYSFIPSSILALFVTIFVLWKDKASTRSAFLFLIALSFVLWSLNDTLQWVTVPANLNLFFWQITAGFEYLVSLLLLYFVISFLYNTKKIPFKIHLLLGILSLPVILLLPTNINISGFDLAYCEGEVGGLITYVHILNVFYVFAVLIFGFTFIFKNKTINKKLNGQNTIVVLSTALFLGIFTLANILGEATKEYVIGLLGPIGMNLFLLMLTYMIVRFKAFNIKLAGAQALVIGLIVLIGSELFFVESTINTVLVSITLILSCIGGFFLVRSVKKEIKQREQLEVLTQKLERANKRLKELDKAKSEFVSIASHQLRSPLTSMRGYASMLLDGSYGPVPQKATEVIQRIADSSRFMARMVENYLNVSRIESGNMKYELSDFNIATEAEKVVDDKRQEAIRKGLLLTYHSQLERQGLVHADIGKTLEIVHNILNNALKYTPKGSIDVLIHDDVKAGKVYVDVTDSGIGMTTDDIGKLFGKFERAKNANSVNITGTGLGLYVARTMALAMKGDIKAFSDGPGTGSTFRLELPIV